MPDITSRRHSLVRAFREAARGDPERALLDGWHLLRDAVAARVDITDVAIAAPPAAERPLIDSLRSRPGTRVVSVTPAVLDAMSPVRSPTGVVALARPRRHAIADLLTPAPALILLAAGVQDPGNLGAIVRAAEAGGATGVIAAGTSADPWGWKALRAAMGSTFRLPIVREPDLPQACQELRARNVSVCAAVPRDGTPMHRVDLTGPTAVIVGSEGGGLDASVLDLADSRISIPMAGAAESLNVAVAAALLVYEAFRQRTRGR